MKVSLPSDNSVAVSANAVTLAAKNGPNASLIAKSSAAKSTQTVGVAVTMSTLARSLETSGSETGEVDMAKVNSVKQAISQGTYVVNPEVIADKLLSNAQEMLPRSRA